MIHNIVATAAWVGLGKQHCLYVDDLSGIITLSNDDGSVKGEVNPIITVREFVKRVFSELGIEIEFSGKHEREKGVIIDVDEDRLLALGLNNDVLRFGQTIVRIQRGSLINEVCGKPAWRLGFSLDEVIKELVEQTLIKISSKLK